MTIKKTLLVTLATFAFAAAAYAASPGVVATPIDADAITAPALEAPPSGVYDIEAGVCIAAADDIENAQQEVRCWKCSADSKGSCGGGDMHCYGERSDCSKKGCKITGSTSKCSGSKKTC